MNHIHTEKLSETYPFIRRDGGVAKGSIGRLRGGGRSLGGEWKLSDKFGKKEL